LKKATVRILVADDYEPWRRYVCSALQKQPELVVVGEVSDGMEAIQKTQELQPDLIVLDIGLPRLNGIEAARRLRQRVPLSKILFFSENRSWDIAEEALRTGALGYVVKWECATELLPAVEAVIRGKLFLSACLTNRTPGGPRTAHNIDHTQPGNAARLPSPNARARHRHEVEFYPDDKSFVDGFARFIEANLKAGNAVIAIATELHRTGISKKLTANGVDAAAAMEQGRFYLQDASETLSPLTTNHVPDPVLCARAVGDLITTAAKGATGEHPWVAICGECAPTLLAEGYDDAAIELEHLWDEITKSYDAETLCGYLSSAFPSAHDDPILERICAEHSAVHGRETIHSSTPPAVR
jgi:DNA-binding NarL/FixJ family response regulator